MTSLPVEQRLEYYNAVCKSLGLNPLTRPFEYIVFEGKMQLYARKDCAEQLRKIHGIAVTKSTYERDGDMVFYHVTVMDRTGRADTGTGAVDIKGLTGKNLANAIMKCETKAKRRATLSCAGLGMLDESELDTVEFNGVTPGGREIIIKEPTDPAMDRYKEREAEQIKQLTPSQREVVERRMKEAEERKNREPEPMTKFEKETAAEISKHIWPKEAEEKKSRENELNQPVLDLQPEKVLYYEQHGENYLITGNDVLMTENRELLKPLWSKKEKAIIATPADLGKLISRFEGKVPFRRKE
jgi:hypothetical protein